MPQKAEKLLESMRSSANNWRRDDIVTLYKGFGFIITHGHSHDIVKHPEYPDLRTTLPRHRSIAKYFVKTAVDLCEKVKSKKGESNV
jgi:hypothetical protein